MITDFIKEESPKRYNVSDIAKNEWKDFAIYTLENRAIPNMIDGMKPVQRFYLYSSIMNSKSEFKKVSAISGPISDYGYQHGETSASGAGQLMAAEWNNNVCLVEGRGAFGTRLVPTAAAPRYTYTKLHKNFGKYIKDIDIAPEHSDPEHEPPSFYIPVIPLVLSNGTKGIATGFATNILPRETKDIIRACKEYLSNGKISKKLKIKFPEFNGTVVQDLEEQNRYFCKGLFEKRGKTVLLITEIPYGVDRESYVTILDKLEESDEIVSYDDLCDKDGFKFEVKLKQNTSANWDDAKIEKEFRLTKPITENLTVIDQNGKLREYTDERDLIKDFCDYRLGILQKRIDLRVKEYNEEFRWLDVKMQFIKEVIDNNIIFKNKKKVDVSEQILQNTTALADDIERLLRINIMSLTDEMVKSLKSEQDNAKKELKFWKTTTPSIQFDTDLEEL